MLTITEGTLEFIFADDWAVTQYDKWDFFQKNLQITFQDIKKEDKVINGVTAVDILAISPNDNVLYFIEVKDYIPHEKTKPEDLAEEKKIIGELPDVIVSKVLCTCAAFLPAKLYAENESEKKFANYLLSKIEKIMIVLHIEVSDDRLKIGPTFRLNLHKKLNKKIKRFIKEELIITSIDNKSEKIRWEVKRNTPT